MENPPIRILQRPCSLSANKSSIDARPPVLVKTLEQREADYAAARRRIMGSEGSDSEGVDEPSAEIIKGVVSENGEDVSLIPKQPLGAPVTNATPLMSIQTGAVRDPGPISDSGSSLPSTTHFSNTAVHCCTAHVSHQGVAVVSVPQKLQQQPQITIDGSIPVVPHQQSRVLTAGGNPSFATNSSRISHPSPFPPQLSGVGNPGLLPTPPGFNYAVQNATLNGAGAHYSYSATLALMHQFALLQPQYQHSLNGFQASLLPPALTHAGPLANQAAYASANAVSGVNLKQSHPPAFM